MSECVVRMEMPEGCWCCPFGHYDWIWGDDGRGKMVCFCSLDLESEEEGHHLLETELKRPSWCPIICQLPEGHGRLGDLDELCAGLVSNHPVVIYAKNAHTIVPAEAERSRA